VRRDPDAAYALTDPAECLRRKAMLGDERVRPLQEWLDWVRSIKVARFRFPNFDPLDGGTEAQLLLLYRHPSGVCFDTGFVSINNPDPTARFVHGFLAAAGIPRRTIACWNVVHWQPDTGDRERDELWEPTKDDLADALDYTHELIRDLKRLRAAMLFGSFAHLAEEPLRSWGVRVIKSPMPSPRPMNQQTHRRAAENAFREAAALLD